ncbi:helix-turn-helix domain-containing protein [Enterococcus faecium]
MTINKLDLLSDSARCQLDILKIFDARKGQFTSVEFLMELLGISKFKVNKYISELEQVLEKMTSARIIRLSKGEIDIRHLSNEVIRKIQLYYLKQSDLFLFFHEMVQFESTPEKFSQKYFLSRSKAYMIKSELEDILSEAGIHINEGKLVGDETKIRREIFDIYYFFFNGLESPFDTALRQKIHETMEVIIHTLNLETIMTRLAKLELFLSIAILRMMKKNYVEVVEIEFDNSYSEEIQYQLSLIQKKIQKTVMIPDKKQECEQLWLLVFLLSEECISLTDYAKTIKSCPDLADVTNKQVDYLFQTLKLSFSEIEKQQRRLQLFQVLNLTNFKLAFANYSRLTFIAQEQVCFFAELYPQFHQVAKKFVEEIRKSNIYNKQLFTQSGLYYDYIFAIISVIPQKYLSDKVYICVDFSCGSAYTSFIAENIKAFQNLNIEIQQKLNNQTQLYVSDIMIDKLNCPQIIWENPPSDHDWLLFGEMVIKVRNESEN